MPTRTPVGYLLGPKIRPLPLYADDVLTMGRERQNSVLIDEILVSRQHAAWECTESGEVFIKDLASRNGTWVNHERIAAKRRVAVHSGDSIRIGSRMFFFVGHEEEAEPQRREARAKGRLEEMETAAGELTADDVKTAVSQVRARAAMDPDVSATQYGLPPLKDAPSLTGNLRDENVAQILQFFKSTGMTGELRVYGSRMQGLIAFRDGDAFFAESGKYQGVHAIYGMARQREGHFAFTKMREPPERPGNVKEGMMRIIFECCKRMDEAELSGMK